MRVSLCVRLCVVCSRFVRVVYSFSVSFFYLHSSPCMEGGEPGFSRVHLMVSSNERLDTIRPSTLPITWLHCPVDDHHSLDSALHTSTFPWLPSLVKSSPLSQGLGPSSRPFGLQAGAYLDGSNFIPAASDCSVDFSTQTTAYGYHARSLWKMGEWWMLEMLVQRG